MSKPQVMIDGTVFEGLGRIGIWRMFYETMSRTSRDVDYTLLLAKDPVQPVPEKINVARFSRGPELTSRRHLLWNLTSSSRQARMRTRFPQHIWHPTFFSLDPRGPARGNSSAGSTAPKRVVTVYDMLSEDYYWMGDFAFQREIKKRCIDQSDHAIAISVSTEERLLRYFPSLINKTDVVHLAGDHTGNFTPTPQEGSHGVGKVNESGKESDAGAAEPYCLFVGGRDLYKHFEFVVRAIASDDWPRGVTLSVIGRPFSEAEMNFIRACGADGKLNLLDSVTDAELNKYYRNACCFVFPSLGEGFGLPVLEAQQNRCIPVLSDIPVFREVGGSGAVYYSPHDVRAFCTAVASTLEKTARENLLASGRANASRFSWDQCAEQVLDCYGRLWNPGNENANR